MGTTSSNSHSEKAYDFKPVDCDTSSIEPDAAPGEYESMIDAVRVQATSKDNYPMLVVDYKLESTSTDTDEAEKSIGAIVTDFITFFPDGDRRGRMGKLKYRQLIEALGIDADILPTRLQSKADFNDLVAALKRQKMTVWVTHRADKETGETRVGVSYTAPKGGGRPAASSRDEEEEERQAPRGKSAPAKAKARR